MHINKYCFLGLQSVSMLFIIQAVSCEPVSESEQPHRLIAGFKLAGTYFSAGSASGILWGIRRNTSAKPMIWSRLKDSEKAPEQSSLGII